MTVILNPTINPTLTEICTEGIKKAGYSTSASQYNTLLSRAGDYWMEEIKNEIWARFKKIKSLQSSAIITTVVGRQRYNMPTDFSSLLEDNIEILYGSRTGTAQAGTVSSITLAASFSATESDMQGKEISIISGTGANQVSQVYAYNNTSKVASLYPALATAPSTDSVYMVIDTYSLAYEKPYWDFNMGEIDKNKPNEFYVIGDSDDGEFFVKPIPDKVYSLRLKYYSDLLEVDISGTLMSTLYKKWRNVWIQGVMAKCLQFMDDARYVGEMQTFYNVLNVHMNGENFGMDMSNIQMVMED